MISKFALAAAGVINILPTLGVFGSKQLEKLYGIPFTEANLVILMRHRAVLFGLSGSFMISAAFWNPQWQNLAITAGLSSMLSFVVLAMSSKNNFNAEIRRIVIIDLIASSALITGVILDYVMDL
jgi:hypothetical protein